MKKFFTIIALLGTLSFSQAGKEIETAPAPEKKVLQKINVPGKVYETQPVAVLKSRKNGKVIIFHEIKPQK